MTIFHGDEVELHWIKRVNLPKPVLFIFECVLTVYIKATATIPANLRRGVPNPMDPTTPYFAELRPELILLGRLILKIRPEEVIQPEVRYLQKK